MPVLCQPSSEGVPSDNTGEMNVARKRTGHLTSHADGSV